MSVASAAASSSINGYANLLAIFLHESRCFDQQYMMMILYIEMLSTFIAYGDLLLAVNPQNFNTQMLMYCETNHRQAAY